MESKSGPVVLCTRVTGLKTYLMAREEQFTPTGTYMMVNGKMVREVEVAQNLIPMDKNIKVTGRKICTTARVLKPILQAINTKANTLKVKGTVMDSLNGQTRILIRETMLKAK